MQEWLFFCQLKVGTKVKLQKQHEHNVYHFVCMKLMYGICTLGGIHLYESPPMIMSPTPNEPRIGHECNSSVKITLFKELLIINRTVDQDKIKGGKWQTLIQKFCTHSWQLLRVSESAI